jgi:site-specific recombinase XerD
LTSGIPSAILTSRFIKKHAREDMKALAVKPTTELTPPLPFDVHMLAGQLSASSMRMYERDFRTYVAYAGSADAAVQVTTLRRWRTHLAQETTFSPNTINRMISAVKRIMKEAANQGYVPFEQAMAFAAVEGVKTAALKDRVKANARTRIEPADMRRLCEAPDTTDALGMRDAALLATLASGALRVSELVAMQRKDIVRKGGYYVVMVLGKNDVEEREAPLSREAVAKIDAWLQKREELLVARDGVTALRKGADAAQEEEFVFTSFAGNGSAVERVTMRPMTTPAVWQIVRKYAEQIGLEHIKPHDFRRFVGTQLARTDIRKAQKALGHKRLETTARHYVLDELEPGLTETLYSTIPAISQE